MTKTHCLQFTAAELMAQARKATTINIVDDEIAEALEKYIASLNGEAQLNEHGAREQEAILLLVLSNRLRMQRDWRSHPEIAAQAIAGPLVINGTARTGSTKLQKLLAASGDFQWLPCWQGLCPALLSGERSEDPAPRIATADRHVRWLNEHAPNARLIHAFSTQEPEEENLLLTQRLFGIYLNAFVFVPSYTQWYMQHRDPLDDFRFLRQSLQYLQWQFRDGPDGKTPRPWVLKAPTYPGCEALFTSVFPGAMFVTPHRDPATTVSSAMSLVNSLYAACSDTDFRQFLGMGTPGYLAQGKQAQSGLRNAHPELRWLDVAYRDITTDAAAVVQQIYAFAGMTLTDAAQRAMRDWESANTQHKHGAHRYTLEDFAVTEAAVAELFADYRVRYAAYL